MLVLCAVLLLFCVRMMIAPNDADPMFPPRLESQPRWNIYREYTLRNRRWTYDTFDIPESAEKVRLSFDFMPTEGYPSYYLELLLFQDDELLWINPTPDPANYTIEGINRKIIFNAKIYLGNGVMTVEWFGVDR